jgi:hypothetical protein
MNAVDPFAGEISERRKVLFRREPARLKAALVPNQQITAGSNEKDHPDTGPGQCPHKASARLSEGYLIVASQKLKLRGYNVLYVAWIGC